MSSPPQPAPLPAAAADPSSAAASVLGPSTAATTQLRPKPSMKRPKRPMTAYNYFFREERQKILHKGLRSYEESTGVSDGSGPGVRESGGSGAAASKKVKIVVPSGATVVSVSSGSSWETSGEGRRSTPFSSSGKKTYDQSNPTGGNSPLSHSGRTIGADDPEPPLKKRKAKRDSSGTCNNGDTSATLVPPNPQNEAATKKGCVAEKSPPADGEQMNSKGKRKRPAPHGKISFESLGKLIAKSWKSVSEDDLAKFQKTAAKDKKRYHREMGAYDRACVAAICMRDSASFGKITSATSNSSSNSGSEGCSTPKASSDSGGTSGRSSPETSNAGSSSSRRPGGRKLSTKQRSEKKSMHALCKQAKEAMRCANERFEASASATGNPAVAASTSVASPDSASVLLQTPHQTKGKNNDHAISPRSDSTGKKQLQQAYTSTARETASSLLPASTALNSSNDTGNLPPSTNDGFSGLTQQQLALIGLQSLQAQAKALQGLGSNTSLSGISAMPLEDTWVHSCQTDGDAASNMVAAAVQGIGGTRCQTNGDSASNAVVSAIPGTGVSRCQASSGAASNVVATATPDGMDVNVAMRIGFLAAQPSEASTVMRLLNSILPLAVAPPEAILPPLFLTTPSANSGGSNAAIDFLITIMLQQQAQQLAQAHAASHPSVDQVVAGIVARDQQQASNINAATDSGGLQHHTTHFRPIPPGETGVMAIAPAAMPPPSVVAGGLVNSTVTVSSGRAGNAEGGQTQSPPSSELSLSILSDVASALSDQCSADSRASSGGSYGST